MSSESWQGPGTLTHAVRRPEEGGMQSLFGWFGNLLRKTTGPEDQSASESSGVRL